MAAPGTNSEEGRGRRLARWLGVDIHHGEEAGAFLLFLCFAVLFGFQYATKSIRQATFVDLLGAESLPWVYLLVAFCSYPVLRIYLKIGERVRQHLLVAITCGVVAVSMGGFWWLFRLPAAWVAILFYVWLSIVFVLTVSQFWFLASRVFDARQAKRLFGFVGAGALLGSVGGGQVARIAATGPGTRSALVVAAALAALAGVLVLALERVGRFGDDEGPGGLDRYERGRGGLELVRQSPHLRAIAGIVVLAVLVSQIVDLQFNWVVERATSGLDERTALFGNLFSIIGVAAFLFQMLFTSRILSGLGVATALKVQPTVLAAGSAALLVAAAPMPALLLPIAVGLKVGENGLRYSLDQATRELLFLPLPAAVRNKAKAFIDVFVQRAAKGLSALLLLPITFGLLTPVEAAWGALGLAILWLAATARVHREYLHAFRRGLSQRRVDPQLAIRISDATTLELLVQSLGSPDPRQVLHSLELLAAHGRRNLVLPLLLHHDDADVRRRTLEILADEGRRDALPLIEKRLRDPEPEIRALAIRILANLSERDVCEMMMPRLDDRDPGIRAAAVACLVNHGDEPLRRRAGRVLDTLLTDADPAIRCEAAKALQAIPEPRFNEHLMALLYDRAPQVARHAIRTVRRRVADGPPNPIYLPTLVALLANRRLKHDARDALVAYGETAIPALVHFLSDPAESAWVQRALPKALARIGTPGARRALLEQLERSSDAFQRRKLIEAMTSLADALDPEERRAIVDAARREIVRYLEKLRDLESLGASRHSRLVGPRLVWIDRHHEPGLLERLLSECLEEHLRNVFGLLTLLYDRESFWAAYRGLLAERRQVRSHAQEFLDNTLEPEIRHDLMVIIDEMPIERRFHLAHERFGVEKASPEATLRRLLACHGGDERAQHLACGALYEIHCKRIDALYGQAHRMARDEDHPLVRETAAWIVARRPSALGSVGKA